MVAAAVSWAAERGPRVAGQGTGHNAGPLGSLADTVTSYQVTAGFASGRFTSRTDLADCVLRQLDDDQNVRKVLAVATVSGEPGFLRFFLTEGIGKKAA